MSIWAHIDVELGEIAPIAPAGYFIGLRIHFSSQLFVFQTMTSAGSNIIPRTDMSCVTR
jgi:hypothetical protein